MTLEIDIIEVLTNTRDIFVHPKKYFAKIKNEKGKKVAFTYFAAISLIGNAIGSLSLFLFLPWLATFIPQLDYSFFSLSDMPNILLYTVVAYALGLVGSFFYAGFLTVLLKLFTKSPKFDKTYRLYVYSWVPNLLLGWLPQLSFFAFLYSVYLMSLGLKSIYELNSKKTIIFIVLLLVISAIINDLLNTLSINTSI